jgi:LysM domain-containing protein
MKWGAFMKKVIISLVLLAAWSTACNAAGVDALQENAPDRYTVVRGDTLWAISGRFLKDPWRWPELWHINSQVQNPHRIYPGDVLVLDRSGAAAQLRLVRTETVAVSPRIRVQQREAEPVPTIPANAIDPFLSKPLVVGQQELDDAPRIVATEESRVVLGVGSVAYVEGLNDGKGEIWQIFRRGDAMIDPDSHEILGYAALYLGEARLRKRGPVSTVEITRSEQEIYLGDRLLPPSSDVASFGYAPHAPSQPVSGRIVSGYGTLMESGPLSVVAISKGSKDGLEPGHVLAIHRNPSAQRGYRNDRLYGRSGPAGTDAPTDYYPERLVPRDGPLYATTAAPVSPADLAKLPEERYGLVMIFRTFDRAAFGLVMQSNRPVATFDVVTNP